MSYMTFEIYAAADYSLKKQKQNYNKHINQKLTGFAIDICHVYLIMITTLSSQMINWLIVARRIYSCQCQFC